MPLPNLKQNQLSFARFHKNAEKQLLPLFRKALNKSIAGVINWVEIHGTDNVPVETLIDTRVWQQVYPKAFQMIGLRMARLEYYNQRKQDNNASKANVIDFLRDVWSGKLRQAAVEYLTGIESALNQTTIDIIKRALGETNTLELDVLGRVRFWNKEIKEKFGNRALAISRTEATTLSNLGKDIGARSWLDEQPGKSYKIWFGRVAGERDTHLATNGKYVEVDDMFTVGGEMAERPGDASLSAKERIGCRCSMIFISQAIFNQYEKRGRVSGGKISGLS